MVFASYTAYSLAIRGMNGRRTIPPYEIMRGSRGRSSTVDAPAPAPEASTPRAADGANGDNQGDGWRGVWAWLRGWTRPGVPVVLRLPRAVALAAAGAGVLALASAWGVGFLQGRGAGERAAQVAWEEQLLSSAPRAAPPAARGLRKGRLVTPESSEYAAMWREDLHHLQLAQGPSEPLRALADFLSERGFDILLRPKPGHRSGHHVLLLLPGVASPYDTEAKDAEDRIDSARLTWNRENRHDYMKGAWWLPPAKPAHTPRHTASGALP